MNSKLLSLLGACVVLAAGCSSTPTRKDSGPIHGSTFSFPRSASIPQPGHTDRYAPVHTAIQGAITQDLGKRGLKQVPTGGDITVAYLVIVGNNVSTAMINDYFGYGRDSAKLQELATKAYTNSKNPNYFEAGTLVVDLLDSKSGKLLFRNYVVRPTLRDPSPEIREHNISEAVQALLSGVQVSSR